MSPNFSCFLTLLLIQITLADIYDNCGGNGENCLIQNKGNKPDPDSGSGDCLAEKVSLLSSKHTYYYTPIWDYNFQQSTTFVFQPITKQ